MRSSRCHTISEAVAGIKVAVDNVGKLNRIGTALELGTAQLAKAEPMVCSYYGPGFDGRRTANGEIFDRDAMTAAHRTLPFGTRLVVCADRCVEVRINDRGPFVRDLVTGEYTRDLDLSEAAFAVIADTKQGLVKACAWRQ
jgi:rare lipoprotein A